DAREIASFGDLDGFGAGHRLQPEIDRHTEKRACETGRDYAADAKRFEPERRMLASGASAEILAGYEDITKLDALGETGVGFLEDMRCDFVRVRQRQIAAGNHAVGVDAVAKHVHFAFDNHALLIVWRDR